MKIARFAGILSIGLLAACGGAEDDAVPVDDTAPPVAPAPAPMDSTMIMDSTATTTTTTN